MDALVAFHEPVQRLRGGVGDRDRRVRQHQCAPESFLQHREPIGVTELDRSCLLAFDPELPEHHPMAACDDRCRHGSGDAPAGQRDVHLPAVHQDF